MRQRVRVSLRQGLTIDANARTGVSVVGEALGPIPFLQSELERLPRIRPCPGRYLMKPLAT